MRVAFALPVAALTVLLIFAITAGAHDEPKLPDGFIRVKLPPGKLPDGVIHVRLPPGEFIVEDIERDGKILLRITAGKTVIETNRFFIGDGNGAALVEAPEKRLNNKLTNEPGSSLDYAKFVTVDKLKAGSLYVTTPSVHVGWVKVVQKKN